MSLIKKNNCMHGHIFKINIKFHFYCLAVIQFIIFYLVLNTHTTSFTRSLSVSVYQIH